MIVALEPRHANIFGGLAVGDAGNARVLERDGTPVALLRTERMWEGLDQVGGIFDKSALRGHGLWLMRQSRELLETLVARDAPRQVRTLCFDVDAGRFCELLGFTYECTWIGAAPDGSDIFNMVWNRRH